MSAPVPFLTLRLWHPVSADKMEMWSWFLVEADAPDWFQELSYECYVRTFGISGVFEQDDTENWRNVTRGTKGPFSSQQTLNYEMGIDLKPDQTWPGPGAAYPTGYAEAAQRSFWSEWLRYMVGE
jgi:PAH dioxygenase large subunit